MAGVVADIAKDDGAMAKPKKRIPERLHYVNDDPSEQSSVSASQARIEFARRLQRAMVKKDMKQSDLARAAAKHMPLINGKPRELRDAISKYIRGIIFPSPITLQALCKALGVSKADLVPDYGVPRVADDPLATFELRARDDGRMWLRINRAVDPEVAVKILSLLKEDE